METTFINKYTDALAANKAKYAAYISQQTAAVKLPQSNGDLHEASGNFLTKSGWVFIVIGVIGFIAGLILKVSGIWIAGLTSVTAGCYLIVKGKQQMRLEAFESAGAGVLASLEKIIATVSDEWTKFVSSQNNGLRAEIINSSLPADKKAEAVANVKDDAWLHVDLGEVKSKISAVDAKEDFDAFKSYLPLAEKSLNESLEIAAKAQEENYKAVAALCATAPASAPKPAAPASKPAAPKK